MVLTAPDPTFAAAREAQGTLVADGRVAIYNIGERTFVMREMNALNTILFLDLILEEVQHLLDAGVLDINDLNALVFRKDDMGAVPKVIKLFALFAKRAPDAVGHAISLAFDEPDPAVGKWILAHILPAQLIDLVRDWMRVNAWRDLKDRFFRDVVDPFRSPVEEEAPPAASPTTRIISSTSAEN